MVEGERVDVASAMEKDSFAFERESFSVRLQEKKGGCRGMKEEGYVSRRTDRERGK